MGAIAPADIFAEALSVVPLIHTDPSATKALAIGTAAASLLVAAGRYPFTDLVFAGEEVPSALRSPSKPDRRLRVVKDAREILPSWKADVIAVAVPGLPDSTIAAARAASGPSTVVVMAVDRMSVGGTAKRLLEKSWRVVIPYREYLPESQLYLLASDRPLSRLRPVPGWTRRLSEGYLPALFRFAKDDYASLMDPPQRPGAA